MSALGVLAKRVHVLTRIRNLLQKVPEKHLKVSGLSAAASREKLLTCTPHRLLSLLPKQKGPVARQLHALALFALRGPSPPPAPEKEGGGARPQEEQTAQETEKAWKVQNEIRCPQQRDAEIAEVELTAEQKQVLDLTLRGHSLFIGGKAGSGKSVLLRRIVYELSRRHLRVAVTASTGIAALNIRGYTCHNFFDLHVHGKYEFADSLLRAVDCVVIDELSIIPGRFLTSFNLSAQKARGNQKLFGGIQAVLCGDFLQLTHSRSEGEMPLFRSPVFQQLLQVGLSTSLRHTEDPQFVKELDQLREGVVPDRIRDSEALNPERSDAIRLYPLRRAADAYNYNIITGLPGTATFFRTVAHVGRLDGYWSQTYVLCMRDEWKHQVLRRIVLKYAPLRAFLKEQEEMEEKMELEQRTAAKDRHEGDFEQSAAPSTAAGDHPTLLLVPHGFAYERRICFAVRVRGTTPEAARKGTSVVVGMIQSLQQQKLLTSYLAYADRRAGSTALTETFLRKAIKQDHSFASKLLKVGARVILVRNLSATLVNGSIGRVEAIEPVDLGKLPRGLRASSHPKEGLNKKLGAMDEGKLCPLVAFDNGEVAQIPWVAVELPGCEDTYYLSTYLLVMPVSLAYAFTVHKVQGLTLDRPITVDCKHMWQCEHLVYVAASRVRKFSQLRLENFTPACVHVNQEALQFCRSLSAPREATEAAKSKERPVASWAEKLSH